MFREQYIRDNDKLHAKETLLMEIKQKVSREDTRELRRARFVRYGAVAAALVLVAGSIFGAVLATRGASGPQAGAQSLSAGRSAQEAGPVEIKSYDDIYALIETMQGYGFATADGAAVTQEAVREDAAADSGSSTAAMPAPAAGSAPLAETGLGNYSETNVQVKGVDEADIVKTDGAYIYYVAENQLNILKADGANTAIVSTTILSDEDAWWGYNSEMFLLGDRLMIVTQGFSTVWINDKAAGYESNTEQTQAVIYDISNRAKPVKVVSLGQSGNYVSSRRVGDYVYLVTAQYVYMPYRDTPLTYIPALSQDGETSLLAASDLYVWDEPKNAAYTVIGAINLREGREHAAAKAVFGGASELYANAEHLLLAISDYDETVSPIAPDKNGKNVQVTTGSSETRLVLLSLAEGKIERLATGRVPGSLLNQFSMDEYKGVFRIVTSVYEWEQRVYTDGVDTYEYDNKNHNGLYTLDASLNVLGKIENLAEDEQVQSVRFDGDVGYFVTFRQVDPLFAVDLADAKNPRVLSALKIPGFSEYLQTYGENLLLGLGYAADEKTGATQGVKLSMFDTSNKRDVRELTTLKVDADYTIVGGNHKAILADPEKNLIAFPADDEYYIYRYTKEKGFEQLAVVDSGDGYYGWNLRGLFIGENFYVLSADTVTVISLNSFERIAKVTLG